MTTILTPDAPEFQTVMNNGQRPQFQFAANSDRPVSQVGWLNSVFPGLKIQSALPYDAWRAMDSAVMRVAQSILVGVNDLKAANLVEPVSSFGTMTARYQVSSAISGGNVSMTGRHAGSGQQDRIEFNMRGVPIPIFWKEFEIGAREIEASRLTGDPVDTTTSAEAATVVAQDIETALFNGITGLTFDSYSVQGYRTFTHRATATAATYGGNSWSTTPANAVACVAGMIDAAYGKKAFGPFALYLNNREYHLLGSSFLTGLDITVLDRIRKLEGIGSVRMAPTMTAGEALLVSLDQRTVVLKQHMDITTLEWISPDGGTHHFKVMAVLAPMLKADYNNQTGIVHATSCY